MGINLEKGILSVPIARETHCMYRLVCLREVIYVCGRFAYLIYSKKSPLCVKENLDTIPPWPHQEANQTTQAAAPPPC